MQQITALDMHFLIKEFQELISAKIDKIYQPEKTVFLIVIHIPNKGKKILKIQLPGYMYLTDFKGDIPEQPSQFCIFLRKYLQNARIREIKQLGFERIIQFTLEKKEGKLHLFLELFSTGNIILTTEDNIIKSALYTKKWRDRTIRGNAEYEYPKKQNNVLIIKKDNFIQIIKTSDKESVVKSLALDFGLGGRYSEELCLRAGIDKSRKKLKENELQVLYKEVVKLRNAKILARSVIINKKVKDIVPVDMQLYKGSDVNLFNSYSEVLAKVLTEVAKNEFIEKKHAQYNKEYNRMQKVITQQKETIKKLKIQIKENQRKGELLYEKYAEVNDILTELNKAKQKYTFKEIREKLKGHKVIKDINSKTKEIIIDIS